MACDDLFIGPPSVVRYAPLSLKVNSKYVVDTFKRHFGVSHFLGDATQEMELSSPMGARYLLLQYWISCDELAAVEPLYPLGCTVASSLCDDQYRRRR